MTDPNPSHIASTLDDLLAFCAVAGRLVARGRDAYDSDETLRLAAEAALHKIGEAVARLPEDFIAAHPEVPWRAMKAARNIVAHRYQRVDYNLIWNGLAHHLPEHAERIRRIVADSSSRRAGSDSEGTPPTTQNEPGGGGGGGGGVRGWS